MSHVIDVTIKNKYKDLNIRHKQETWLLDAPLVY